MKIYLYLTTLSSLSLSQFLLQADAQPCTPLCGSTNQQLAITPCTTQSVASVPFTPCCDNGASRASCPDGRKCRSVVFSGEIGCPGQGQVELHCRNRAETVLMTIDLVTQSRPGACCAECSCSGDPHCYAFNGKQDDFIICDARDVKNKCAISKSVCATQTDPAGVQCIYHSNNGTCTKDPLTPIPNMLFYQKGNVAITLELADRGVADAIIVKEGNNILSLHADDCINKPNNPWEGTPIGKLISSQHGRVWTYTLPGIQSELTVNCVPRGTQVVFARLDVSVVDISETPGGVPAGVTGFCATGEINTGLATTDVTDAIRLGNLCSSQPIGATAKNFNNGKIPNDISAFIKKWCKKYMGGVPQTDTAGIKACMKNINNNGGAGWARVFCTASTIVSKDLNECDGTQDCRVCVNDIMDFGWPYAIDKWDIMQGNGTTPASTCIKIADLPDDLLDCQRGIRIQYLNTDNSTWVTYKAIPHGYRLCSSSGSFNSNDDSVLFNNNIRFTECGSALLPPGTCPDQGQQLCDAEDGFVVTINTIRKTETPQLGIVDLVDNNELICNPSMYPNNPNGCFEEQLNPCPTCTGKCKPTGYNSPCDNSQDACGTCPKPSQ